MITAKEAKEQTEIQANKKAEKLLNKIEKKIKKTIRQGAASCMIRTNESEFVVKTARVKLADLKYQTCYFNYRGLLEISWEEEIGF